MNKQEIRAIVREMQRIVGILPPEDAGVFGKISAAFEAILERDADTQRRLAALERVSGGTPGARGEETAAPTSPPIRAVAGPSVICRFCECRWKRHPDGTFQIYGPMFVPCPKCDNSPDFLQNVRAEDPDDFEPPTSNPEPPTYEGPRSRPYIRVEPTSPAAWTEEQLRDLCERIHARIDDYGGALEFITDRDELKGDLYRLLRGATTFAPPKPAPSVEDCERAYKSALEGVLGARIDVTKHERAAIAAVRALMLESNKGDGASVSGDSGPKAGHNMERGSGCPASDHHADRETSTPQGPKDPAPSPAFTPDREALPRRLACHGFDPDGGPRFATDSAGPWCLWKEVAPLIAERDALRKERDELREKVDDAEASLDLQWKANQRGIKAWQASAPNREATWPDQARMVEFILNDRDALRARIAELERNLRFAEEARSGYEATADAVQTLGEFLSERGAVMAGHQHSYVVNAARKRIAELEARKPTVTRDAIAESITCHSQTTLTNIMVVVLKRAGIEVTP